ncbi:MAG: succinyl-diaminopimelate desuccinylase [Urechidicola sp.]|jgi:succinyl-diaminopimelate desuccinylase
MESETLTLLKSLISKPSVTPVDLGCQQILIERLAAIGFECETMQFGEVTNLWARRGTSEPVFAFAGHTDVVPTGPVEEWDSDPFIPEVRDGLLFGRGTADMKAGIAAMVTACERFVADHSDHFGSIAFLITSDEEGPAKNGTVKVIETLETRGEKIKWALVGEPSSTEHLGDIVKNGRRGSLGAVLTVRGIQGHVAYPQLADNPIHKVLPALNQLRAVHWDDGNEFFPPTSFQISNIHSGTGVTNVIPGHIEVTFNLRYSTELDHHQIIRTSEAIFEQHGLDYDVDWNLSGLPFLTSAGSLVDAAKQSIKQVTGIDTELSTAGGTSDGRFIAPTGAQVLELGPVNATIHQINEHVRVSDVDQLSDVYQGILEKLLTKTN